MLRHILKRLFRKIGYEVSRCDYRNSRFPILRPIDPNGIDILADHSFQASCLEISQLTLLDTDRLANLWQLCRLSNPVGSILEVGTYKGGGALHLSNSCPDRKVFVCDSFQGFETLDRELDSSFSETMFKDSSKQTVEKLFLSHQRKVEVIGGFFPASVKGKNLGSVSFIHLDVDVYKATLESLCYISEQLAIEHSLIVLDDYLRNAKGVDQAVHEFTQSKPDWICFPLFPGQGLLLHSSWFRTMQESFMPAKHN